MKVEPILQLRESYYYDYALFHNTNLSVAYGLQRIVQVVEIA